MSASAARYPILADTSALVATANTSQWEAVRDTLQLTTTNVCVQELRRHERENHEYAREGSREYQLNRGSRRAIAAIEDPETPWSSITCVPRPHGADAGEESLQREVVQHPDVYEVVAVMDDGARKSIRRALDRREQSVQVVAPTYLFYLLQDSGVIDRERFCTVCGEMLENEGWTGYKAVKIAWEQIPVNCDDVLEDDLLPP